MHSRSLLCAMFLSAASGCTMETLNQGLPESDANDIVSLLRRHSIPSHKVRDAEGPTYSVQVSTSTFADAVALEHAASLPRPTFQGLSMIQQNAGLVMSPESQRALHAYTLGQSISQALVTSLPGVSSAQALVALSDDADLLGSTKSGPSASVMLQYRLTGEGVAPFRRDDVQRLVASAVPDLHMNPEAVAVFMSVAPIPSPDPGIESPFELVLGIQVARDSALALRLLLGSVAGVLAAFAAALAWVLKAKRPAPSKA